MTFPRLAGDTSQRDTFVGDANATTLKTSHGVVKKNSSLPAPASARSLSVGDTITGRINRYVTFLLRCQTVTRSRVKSFVPPCRPFPIWKRSRSFRTELPNSISNSLQGRTIRNTPVLESRFKQRVDEAVDRTDIQLNIAFLY